MSIAYSQALQVHFRLNLQIFLQVHGSGNWVLPNIGQKMEFLSHPQTTWRPFHISGRRDVGHYFGNNFCQNFYFVNISIHVSSVERALCLVSLHRVVNIWHARGKVMKLVSAALDLKPDSKLFVVIFSAFNGCKRSIKMIIQKRETRTLHLIKSFMKRNIFRNASKHKIVYQWLNTANWFCLK